MENDINESNDLDDTIVDNEFIHPILKNINNYSNPKIISFITEYMSLSLNEKIARYLINKNIRNIRNPLTSDTLMHYLCINDENFPLLKLIKPNLKEMEQKNNLGQTLLHIAVQNKSYKIIKYLIENGSNFQSKDNKNNTPLIIAINNLDYKSIELIMKYNQKRNILNNNKIALDLARNKNDKILTNLLNNNEVENNTNAIEEKIINNQRKKNFLYRGYRGTSGEKIVKSNIYNSSVNNCSLETKNETDNQSLNIYRKKIVSKDSKNVGEKEKRIKYNKTISLNFNFSKNNATPDKKSSYSSINRYSPLINRARYVYRKTNPKAIDKKDSYIEFDKDSNLIEFEANIRHLSPIVLRKTGNISSFSIKKRDNNIINKSNYIKCKNIINDLNKCESDINPKIKIIKYDKLNNSKNDRIKSQKKNSSPISLKDLDNDYEVKKVRNTLIQRTPFVNFKKNKKNKKEELNKEQLLEFLKEIGMQHYINILIKEGFDDINLILNQMKQGFPLLDDSLKEIGISSPGDRAKILIRMQEISDGFNFVFPFEQVYFKNNRSIQRWLNKEGLPKYINNFIDAGYQSLELLLIQMASKYKINDKILHNDLNITNDEDRKNILKSLENNCGKYVYELTKNQNVSRTYSKMMQNNSGNFCSII